MYLIDASALIFAKNHYYQFDRVPQFWEWLRRHVAQGSIKVPFEIYNEITKQDDDLKLWIAEIKNEILVSSDDYDLKINEVLFCYSQGGELAPADLQKMGADPYLVACALHLKATVVTGEVSKPARQGTNRKIPDVCNDLKVAWTNVHGMKDREGLINLLDFRAR